MKVSICVSYRKDKPSQIIKDEIYLPFSSGSSNLESLWDSRLLADGLGKNISDRNDSYCELTTQYWAWKNLNADFLGFCHYRRFFSFAKNDNESNRVELDSYNFIHEPFLSPQSIRKHRLTDRSLIEKECENCDLILPTPANLKINGYSSARDQYCNASNYLHRNDLEFLEKIIADDFPAYAPYAKKYLSQEMAVFCNMFIMKRTLFEEYSSFLFAVLEKFYQNTNIVNYNIEATRVVGHLGERVLGIFWEKCKAEKKVIKYKPIVIFSDTSSYEFPRPSPFKEKDNLPIVFSSSEQFLPYCSVAISSIVNNSNPFINYDIFILHRGIPEHKQRQTIGSLPKLNNISIRFLQLQDISKQFDLREEPEIKLETYFRLLIPEIFVNFNNVLYLDCDLVVIDDLAYFLHLDLQDKLLAASRDIAEIGNIYGKQQGAHEYVRGKLELKNANDYFNAGVLLINIKKFRETFTSKYLLEFAEATKLRYQDQDSLNVLCEDKVKFISQKWNFTADPVNQHVHWLANFAPAFIARDYLKSESEPKIVHFNGPHKPWKNPTQKYAWYFWKFARFSPFYEELQTNLTKIKQTASQINTLPKMMLPTTFWNKGRKKILFKIFVYYLASKISLGERKKRFTQLKEINLQNLKQII